MTFDMTQDKKLRYQVHVYGWNVDDKYLFSDYTPARIMYTNLIERQRLYKSNKLIITITDVITSERINHEAETISRSCNSDPG